MSGTRSLHTCGHATDSTQPADVTTRIAADPDVWLRPVRMFTELGTTFRKEGQAVPRPWGFIETASPVTSKVRGYDEGACLSLGDLS